MNPLYTVKHLGNTAAELLSVPLKPHNAVLKRLRGNKKDPHVKRILLMKMWGIGNITILLPILKTIRERHKDALIYFFTLDSNKGLIEGSGFVSRVFYFPLTSDLFRLSLNTVKYLFVLKKLNPDLLLNFEQCNRFSAVFCYLIGAKRRVGFEIAGCGCNPLYTDTVKNDPALHASRNFANLARKAGIAFEKYEYIPPATDQASKEKAKKILLESGLMGKKIAALHTGSGENFTGKRWRGANFARLADELIKRYGVAVVYTGTEKEKGLIKDTISKMRYKAFDFCSYFTLKELVELLRHCYIFISNDTGPLHIAISLGINTVGLYGPMNPRQYRSLNENSVSLYKSIGCNPCLTDSNSKTSLCKNPRCLDKITVEEVLDNIGRRFFKEEETSLAVSKQV